MFIWDWPRWLVSWKPSPRHALLELLDDLAEASLVLQGLIHEVGEVLTELDLERLQAFLGLRLAPVGELTGPQLLLELDRIFLLQGLIALRQRRLGGALGDEFPVRFLSSPVPVPLIEVPHALGGFLVELPLGRLLAFGLPRPLARRPTPPSCARCPNASASATLAFPSSRASGSTPASSPCKPAGKAPGFDLIIARIVSRHRVRSARAHELAGTLDVGGIEALLVRLVIGLPSLLRILRHELALHGAEVASGRDRIGLGLLNSLLDVFGRLIVLLLGRRLGTTPRRPDRLREPPRDRRAATPTQDGLSLGLGRVLLGGRRLEDLVELSAAPPQSLFRRVEGLHDRLGTLLAAGHGFPELLEERNQDGQAGRERGEPQAELGRIRHREPRGCAELIDVVADRAQGPRQRIEPPALRKNRGEVLDGIGVPAVPGRRPSCSTAAMPAAPTWVTAVAVFIEGPGHRLLGLGLFDGRPDQAISLRSRPSAGLHDVRADLPFESPITVGDRCSGLDFNTAGTTCTASTLAPLWPMSRISLMTWSSTVLTFQVSDDPAFGLGPSLAIELSRLGQHARKPGGDDRLNDSPGHGRWHPVGLGRGP